MNDIRILIVDDLLRVRQGLVTVLGLAAMKTGLAIKIIGEAQNGIEAIQQAQLLRPDVILMDLEMPAMDGYEATRCLKTIDPACRVIVLTVHDNEAARQKASRVGADAFLVKGAPVECILQTISQQKE